MKPAKLQKGFTFFEIALVIIIVAVASGSAWYVTKHNKSAKKSGATSLTTAATSAGTGTTTNSGELSIYQNNDLGFKFTYPTAYGAVSPTKKADTTGKAYEYTFTFANRTQEKENLIYLKMENSNFDRGGIGSVCNLGIGLADATYKALAPLSGDWVSSRSIVSEQGLSGIESVSFPDDITTGEAAKYCSDTEITIDKQISNPNFEVAKVFSTYRSKEVDKLKSQAEYNTAFANNPNNFVSVSLRDELVAIARSITNL